MIDIFGHEGCLASNLNNYESRPGQMEMAAAIQTNISMAPETSLTGQADCLVVEAETGLGKTLAYLIPAALSNRRVVISTNTKNLQDQILKHEIPFIKEHIVPGLKAICVKGRQNYLCLSRWNQYRSARKPSLFEDDNIERIGQWLEKTFFAERSELSWLSGNSPLWHKICCQSHLCLGADCQHHSACFLNKLRREAATSHLLIVNHHLLFSDLAVRQGGFGEVLPRYEAVIFDEAHHVENVATTFFGFSFSKYQILDLAGDIERSCQLSGNSQKALAASVAAQTANTAAENLAATFPMEKGRFELSNRLLQNPEIIKNRTSLIATLQRLIDILKSITNQNEPWEHYSQRAQELSTRMESITAEHFIDIPEEEAQYIYWYERTDRNLTLSATPVEIASALQKSLFSNVGSCIFTSATLSTGGTFDYFFERLGLDRDIKKLTFPSPFDYQNRTLLYIPDNSFPEPAATGYSKDLHHEIEQLLSISEGRALVLFTSYRAMQSAFHELQDRFHFPILIQGTAPRHELLTSFTKTTNSALFAVSSFWEGVDVPGDTLSMVIIDKIPFEVPSDPVIMARMNRIKAIGGNPFFDFQVPRAILSLRQGFGRLMRRMNDQGVVSILDVRLFTKRYGQRFMKSLPPSPVVRDRESVKGFFSEDKHF